MNCNWKHIIQKNPFVFLWESLTGLEKHNSLNKHDSFLTAVWRSWRWAGETVHLTSYRPGGPRCLVVHGLQFKCQVKCSDLLCRQRVGVLNDRSAIISKPFSHLSYGCFLCAVLIQVVTVSFSATSPQSKKGLCTKWAFICLHMPLKVNGTLQFHQCQWKVLRR